MEQGNWRIRIFPPDFLGAAQTRLPCQKGGLFLISITVQQH
jgi:hypothetical protein